MKTCSKCGIEKHENEYSNRSDIKHLLRSWCKMCYRDYSKESHKNNREEHNIKSREYCQIHKSDRNKRCKEYRQCESYKIKVNIRCLIYLSLKRGNYSKKSKTAKLLCCSRLEFQNHLGPQPSLTCQLDHICPCAQAQNEEELIKLQHYSNFRWLEATENLTKSDSWTLESEELCKSLLGRPWICKS